MIKPRPGILLEAFDGSDRGFAFATEPPFGAFVLDAWSFTVLEALYSDTSDNIRQQLIEFGSVEYNSRICSNFNNTINRLKQLNLVEEVE
jgi:hypothetical protein